MPHTPCQLVLPGEKSTRNFHLVAEDTLTLHLIEFTVSRSTVPGAKAETVIKHRMHIREREAIEGNTPGGLVDQGKLRFDVLDVDFPRLL
jgi:hypothetical protein